MDRSKLLANILSRAVECASCQARNPPDAGTCISCGASLVDEPSVSVLAQDQGVMSARARTTQRKKGKKTLEDSTNYLRFKNASEGIRNGSVSEEEYRAIVKKLRNLADSSLMILDSAMVKLKMASAPAEEVALTNETRDALNLLQQGTIRMEAYLSTHNLEDLTQGVALVEEGFVAVEIVEHHGTENESPS